MRGSRDEGWTPPELCKDKKKYNLTIYKKNELTVTIDFVKKFDPPPRKKFWICVCSVTVKSCFSMTTTYKLGRIHP